MLLVVVEDPQCGSGVFLQSTRILSTGICSVGVGSANTSACCTDSQTGVLQECLSLPVRSGLSVPLGPLAAPGWGRVRAGETDACARALSSSTWHPAEPSGLAPLRCTCMRCTGAEGNRFPSVSCAAAEPCAGPALRPVPALPCAAATSASSLAGGELKGPPLLPRPLTPTCQGASSQLSARSSVCPHRLALTVD